MDAERLIELARESDMFVTVEMKWQYARWEKLAELINDDMEAHTDKGNPKMNFGKALEAMKSGLKVSRDGWNGKDMFLFLVPGSSFEVNRPPLLGIYPAGTVVSYHAHVDMKTAQGDIVPWLCSQTDMLAEDWGVV